MVILSSDTLTPFCLNRYVNFDVQVGSEASITALSSQINDVFFILEL